MPKLHRSYLLNRLAAGAGLLFAGAAIAQTHKHPNVIYVFPDQLRNCSMGFWQDSRYSKEVGWRGDPTITPNLNRFASQSVVFTNAMSNCPVSSAHRGMLLTGLYPNKSGVSLNCNATRPLSDLRDDLTCIGDIFHQSGYQCAYIGKLHATYPSPAADFQKEGSGQPAADGVVWDTYTPEHKRHGFDFWYSYGTFDQHKNPHYWDAEGNYYAPAEYSPKHEADVVIRYLENRDVNKPFFIMVGMNPPHAPYRSTDDCMEEDLLLYQNQPSDSLLVRKNINPALEDKKACAPYYFANVTGVDREFGRILDALDALGLTDETIVVFASDHGETMCSHVRDPKNTPYTESMNIPFIVRYPKVLQPAISHNMLSAIDIMPTVVSLAGLKEALPDSLPGYDWAGKHPQRNLTRSSKRAPKSVLYLQNVDGQKDADGLVTSYFARCRGIVTEQYTLSFTINKKGQLKETLFFDNIADPYQNINMPVDPLSPKVKTLMKELRLLLIQADDPWIQDGTLDKVEKQLMRK